MQEASIVFTFVQEREQIHWHYFIQHPDCVYVCVCGGGEGDLKPVLFVSICYLSGSGRGW